MSEFKFVHLVTPHETLEVPVEVVSTPSEIAKGLMNRAYLGDNSGFLFEFGKETKQSFWMKDTEIPLSIAFFDNNGTIISIQDMQPFSTEPVNSPAPYVGALEVKQGFFERHEIKVHDKIKIESSAHPLRIGETLNYDGQHAEASHHGIEDHEEIIPWDEVDWGLVTLPRPRLIKSNRPPKRNHLGFRLVSFVKKKGQQIVVPEFWTKLKHPSPSGMDMPNTPEHQVRGGRPIDPDRVEESWQNVNEIYTSHGQTLDAFSNRLFASAKQAIKQGETDQLSVHRAARANDFEPQDVIDMGTQIHRFSRHAMASAIALFSPKQRMYVGRGAHNNTLHQTIMAMDMVGQLGSDKGMQVTQDHLNQIEQYKSKLKERIAASKDSKQQTRLTQHLGDIKAPSTPGTYTLDDFSDHGVLAMMTGGGSRNSKLAAIKLLASEKRRGATPLRIEDVVRRAAGTRVPRDPETGKKMKDVPRIDKYEIGLQSGPKVVSFAHNLEFPDESESFTSDARIKSLLYMDHKRDNPLCGSNCSTGTIRDEDDDESEAIDDPYNTSGWDVIDTRSDKRGQGAWPKSLIYPDRSSMFYGPGATYQWQGAGADEAFKKLFGKDRLKAQLHGIPMNIQRMQNLIWPQTVLNGDFGNLDPAARDFEKERLAAPLDEFFMPSSLKEHLEKGQNTSLACRHVHPYLEMANQIRAKRMSVVRDPSTIQSIVRSYAGGIIDPISSGPRVEVKDKNTRQRIEVTDKSVSKPSTPAQTTKSPSKSAPSKSKPSKSAPSKSAPSKSKPTQKSPAKKNVVKKKTPTKTVKKTPTKKPIKKNVVKKTAPTLKPR